MRNQYRFTVLFAMLLTLLAFVGTVACGPLAPAPAPTQAPTKAALDVRAMVQNYIETLPDSNWAVTPAGLQEQLAGSKPFLVDVRSAQDVATNGYIEGAVNIPIRTLAKNLDKLPQDKTAPIVVYCGIGHNGAQSMMALHLLGYTNVKSVAGGFAGWTGANLPVVKGPIAAPVAGKAAAVDADRLALVDQYLSNLPDDYNAVAPAGLKDQLAAGKPVVLDVRNEQDLKTNGMIVGALNVPIRNLFKNLDKLPQDKNAPIVTHCSIGHNGAQTMMALRLLGYTNVKSLAGGFAAWAKAGLPVVKPG
ncbi:MAG: rhodanese-like domain-containing protein [Chloroflexi bacterium]|nr:rhodanese-like domain-containing protein [Chloroflexota bacterium]